MLQLSYTEITEQVMKKNIIPYFNSRYKIFIDEDINSKHYHNHINLLLDDYNQSMRAGFNDTESKVNALHDSIDRIIQEYNIKSEERDRFEDGDC